MSKANEPLLRPCGPDVGVEDLSAALAKTVARTTELMVDLEEKNEELARLNAELTAAKQGLEHMNERLKSVMEEKEEFLRTISHDMQAPARNISGHIDFVIKHGGPELSATVRERLDRIGANAHTLQDYVNELLNLSRLGRMGQPPEATDSGALAQAAIETLAAETERHGVEIVVPKPLPVVVCQPIRLRQVFQNLLDNAIKYRAADRRCRIEITAEVTPAGARFAVRDNGIGIPKDDQHKVFGVFYRVANKVTAGVDGKGVGLAAVKRIVETHGGEIWVDSEVGVGSVFSFTVPSRQPPPRDPHEELV
ncbi:MAG: HAMP domain-containing histidine kinase [Deltaproteobacteria bacterium]|nr:HAMP domain-containing histidine kinase [Deltaproteobacteria bacterium]